FRPSRCAEFAGLENRGEHAVDRTHTAAFSRSSAHRRSPLHARYLIVLSLLDRRVTARVARCLRATTATPVNRQIATMSVCSMFASREARAPVTSAVFFAPAGGVKV